MSRGTAMSTGQRRWRQLLLPALLLLGARHCFTSPWSKSRRPLSSITRAAEAAEARPVSDEEKRRVKAEFREVFVAKLGDLPLPLTDIVPSDYNERFRPVIGGLGTNLLALKDLIETLPKNSKATGRWVIKAGDEVNRKRLLEERAARLAEQRAAAEQKRLEAPKGATKAGPTLEDSWMTILKGAWNAYLKETPAEQRNVKDVIAKLTELSEAFKEPVKTNRRRGGKKWTKVTNKTAAEGS